MVLTVLSVILLIVASTLLGASTAVLCCSYKSSTKENSPTPGEMEEIADRDAFVKSYAELLVYEANKIEDDFIRRICEKADQILAGKEGVHKPDDSGECCDTTND